VSSYSTAIEEDVVAYFEGKTEAILKRYGPGPRVHYHAGLVDDEPPPNKSAQFLRQRLVAAQERILRHAAEVWDASSTLRGDVLDVGCGLGGGAIFWAQEFGAQVTAVTCVPSHVKWVARFAVEAGVRPQVQPLLCNALDVPGEGCFDAAVAVDSSGYLPRDEWFHHLALLLRAGGRVFISDCFLGQQKYKKPFDHYWHTRIGMIDEYLAAARREGLRAESIEDISHRTQHFWSTTLALLQAEACDNKLSHDAASKRDASVRAHSLVRQGLADGSLRYALMSFSKCS
jgi:tocopherol O-methyltransferase